MSRSRNNMPPSVPTNTSSSGAANTAGDSDNPPSSRVGYYHQGTLPSSSARGSRSNLRMEPPNFSDEVGTTGVVTDDDCLQMERLGIHQVPRPSPSGESKRAYSQGSMAKGQNYYVPPGPSNNPITQMVQQPPPSSINNNKSHSPNLSSHHTSIRGSPPGGYAVTMGSPKLPTQRSTMKVQKMFRSFICCWRTVNQQQKNGYYYSARGKQQRHHREFMVIPRPRFSIKARGSNGIRSKSSRGNQTVGKRLFQGQTINMPPGYPRNSPLTSVSQNGLVSSSGVSPVLSPSTYVPKSSEKLLLPPLRASDANKNCLIIDLDETLVHSSFKPVNSPDFVVPVEIDGVVHQVYVLKRPYVDEFLQRISKLFECVLFTASLAKYAEPVANLLDRWEVFRSRLYRDSCVYQKGNYIKDLDRLGRDLKRVIIVDNSPASYAYHPDNAIPVQSWFDDMQDTELLDLLPFLDKLAKVDNAYELLRYNGGVSVKEDAAHKNGILKSSISLLK